MPADAHTLTIARLSRLLESNAPAELSFPQYRVLGLLAGGDERASQLASRLAVAKPTLTAVVDSLVERAFVTRDSADGDRRVVSLSITSAGRSAMKRAEREFDLVLRDVVARCDHPDAVLAALDEVRRALDSRWVERAAAEQPAPRKLAVQ